MADPLRQAAQTRGVEGERLPPGRHGLPRAVIAENQRERLLNGVVEAVAECGYNATTITHITAAAKISRRTFYEHFDDKEACFLAAYEMIEAHVLDSILSAPGAGEAWPARVRPRLAALLDVLSRDAAVSRCFLVEPLAAGGDVAVRCREAMRLVAATLRPEPAPAGLDMAVRDQALIGGLTTLVARRLAPADAARLPDLLPDLTELALAPYMTRDEAKRLAANKAI